VPSEKARAQIDAISHQNQPDQQTSSENKRDPFEYHLTCGCT